MTTATVRVTLADLVDRLLDRGAAVSGQVLLGLADIDLVLVDLRVLLTGVESARRRGGPTMTPLHRDAAPREPTPPPPLPPRVLLDDQRPAAGIAGVVLLVADLIRDVMEAQAVARMEGGSLTDAEAERLGDALRDLDSRIEALRDWLNQDATQHSTHAIGGEDL